MIDELILHFRQCTIGQASALFLIGNIGIFLASATVCWIVARLFARKQIFDRFEPVRPLELAAALGAVALNVVVSVVGWRLWVAEWIELREAASLWRGLVDAVVMVLAMDLAMYVSHRLAHIRWVYPIVHRFHHRHEVTNPISLFVLHPLEVIGFGSMMIGFLMIYRMSPLGLVIYLNLNVLFGTLGHCGVEPLPSSLLRVPLLNLLGTSTFHAEHHQDQEHNFGFYTLFWDWLLGTLSPDYWEQYANPVAWRTRQQEQKREVA